MSPVPEAPTGHFHPDDGDPVPVALAGFARANRRFVEVHESPAFLTARHRNPRRVVGLVSGGGSGHEPLHAGFLGEGMLDAVAPGKVFASPHNRQVLEASRHAAGDGGVLHVVKNYTGDRINFGIAAERLRLEGIEVRRVLVDDDLATESADTATGRRGTAATVVVEKILGAAADDGAGIDDLAELGARVAAASRSIAVASRAQTTGADGTPAFDVAAHELEYGVGIHGERASATITRPTTPELVRRMTDQVLDALPPGGDVILVVNGLGAVTLLELNVIFEYAAREVETRGGRVVGELVGTYVPALDMRGFSVTMTRTDGELLSLWDAPAFTPSFPNRSVGTSTDGNVR
ncbi:dihydroxyacetone kinase subunit DhaK [Mycolicibacterium sediminis]|uniref:Dihydroxyacetone kinase subunit DhaK n=1 Tax=Mycolicibacterium sediminis TaxID=1286180 RepID=A0A7I7QRW7_9MYCO|nr:dihydroxyacetone kinase subunit DhaK [Mycolicibacterium sediminis]BBY28556.1 dihydroxyacetone kinase subunit DhaK [Mycolicibacterium sediminis]